MAASEAQQKLEELHATLNADLEKTRRELNEMDALLRQTTSEVEKLAQREMTVANRLRDLEVNVDKYSKADIKNFYTSAQEVQMRLLMMRGQLDQLQFRQQALKTRQSQLFEIVSALEPLVVTDLGGSAPRGGVCIWNWSVHERLPDKSCGSRAPRAYYILVERCRSQGLRQSCIHQIKPSPQLRCS